MVVRLSDISLKTAKQSHFLAETDHNPPVQGSYKDSLRRPMTITEEIRYKVGPLGYFSNKLFIKNIVSMCNLMTLSASIFSESK